jgi:hypothetical protein
MRASRTVAAAGVVLGAWLSSSCSPSGFQSETVIDTVRILASRASEPRATPGDNVKVEVLAYDGRINPTTPMQIYWLKLPCVNPLNDAYFACFPQFLGIDDAGTPGPLIGGLTEDAGALPAIGDAGLAGLAGLLKPGVDLSPILATGPSLTVPIPDGIIVPRTGVSASYGLMILFNFACAGHIGAVAFDPNSGNPQQVPLGCFDANNQPVGPDGFVLGFTRVYVQDQPTEENPMITEVDTGGQRLEVDGGVTTARLEIDGGVTTEPFVVNLCGENNANKCDGSKIGPVVPSSKPTTKQVWADFYSTVGQFNSNARLLFDPMQTLSIPAGTNNIYLAPNNLVGAPANNFIWIVVHDDQGGADWVTVPLTVLTK